MKIDLKKDYIDWLNENIEQYQISDTVYRLTLPYLDRNNDYIEIFIFSQDNGTYRLTDDSETINELELSNFSIFSSPKRKSIFNTVINSHGVSLSEHNELYIESSRSDLPLKKHMLTQCIMKISDLFYLSQKNVKSIFLEDVRSFLEVNDIRHSPNISFTGKSKLTTNYDFVINKSKHAPERIIQVVNNLDVTCSKSILFNWTDTRETREPNTTLYTFIHDVNKKVSEDAITALHKYNVKTILWTKRNDYIDELSA